MIGKTALVAAGLMLALGTVACTDVEAEARAEAEAKAVRDKAEADRKLQLALDHNIECINALRWQAAALSGAGIGKLSIYTDYFRETLDTTLGGELIRKDPPAPILSRATLQDHLEWAYANDVKVKFTAGKDADGNGTISAHERNHRGFSIVLGCIQQAAEMGKGPLAGGDKVQRMYRIQDLRKRLKDKGA
jgi:hypothetical protein